MRVARRLLAVLVFSALFACGYALAAGTSVSLTAQGPQPATVTVDWGDTVTFSNADTVDHGVNSTRAGISNVTIPPGGTFEHRFAGRAGRYNYTQTGSRPNFSGVVELTAAGKVTLRLSKDIGVYGSIVTLSGRSSYGGTPVLLEVRLAGASGDWTPLASPTATADGTYSAQIRLTAGGRVRARVAEGQVSSTIEDLAVQPRLAANVRPRRAAKGARVMVTGRIVPASAASSADLEEFDAERKTWTRKASKAVSKSGTVTFTLKAEAGRTRLRISLKRAGLEPGFIPVTSRPLLVVSP